MIKSLAIAFFILQMWRNEATVTTFVATLTKTLETPALNPWHTV